MTKFLNYLSCPLPNRATLPEEVWHPIFAFFPHRIQDGSFQWLRVIERRMRLGWFDCWVLAGTPLFYPLPWEYRLHTCHED